MTYQKRGLDADEQADLANRRGPYSADEIRDFENFCGHAFRLAELQGVRIDACAGPHPCPQNCGNRAPAGLPIGLVGSKWDLCPACVRAKRMVRTLHKDHAGAIELELSALTVGDEQTERAAFFDAVGRIGRRP